MSVKVFNSSMVAVVALALLGQALAARDYCHVTRESWEDADHKQCADCCKGAAFLGYHKGREGGYDVCQCKYPRLTEEPCIIVRPAWGKKEDEKCRDCCARNLYQDWRKEQLVIREYNMCRCENPTIKLIQMDEEVRKNNAGALSLD